MVSVASEMLEQVHVVIIGAGAAGLAAGCRLIENGFEDFVIVEASDRIGGRVHSIPYNKGSIDLGAEWVHGEEGNVVYEMASKYSLLYKPESPFEKSIIYKSNGVRMDQEISEKLIEIMDDIIDGHPDEIKKYNGSLGQFFKQHFWPLIDPLIKNGKLTHAEAQDCLIWLEYVENSIDASPDWDKTAANEATEYVKLPGSVLNTWKMGGYQTALDLLTKKWPNPKKSLQIEKKIRLKKEVTKIDWSGSRVEITCADGSEFSAERVLTTISLNVLKANADKIFKPNLPEQHLKAIRGLGMATVDKIFIEFPYRWWESGSGGFNLVWNTQDLAKVSKDKEWITGVFGFYGSDNHPTVLCGWMVGKFAEVMESVPDSQVLSECMDILRRFVKDQEIPEPVRLTRSQWFSNPFVRGSYTCRMVESDELNVWPHDLAKPVSNIQGKQVLLFAGEATHEHFFSTVHGAIESGQREAERILKLCERDVECTVAIIGAGIAGLSAAKVLTSAGINVKVFEAQNSPGGRIRTIKTDSGLLEMGAQWLHGENTELFRWALSKGLVSDVSSAEGQGKYCLLGGKTIPFEIISRADNIVNDILSKCEDFVDSENFPKSIGEELVEKFKNAFKDCEYGSEILNWHKKFQIIDNSCDDLNRLSARAWGLYEDCGKMHCINFINGFSSIIEQMVAELPPETVICNTPIRRIEWMPNCFKTPSVKIISDHFKATANHVIVTTSLGYLKDYKDDLFRPLLPEKISRAIELLGFGTIVKIFLIYDKPWWNIDDKGFQFLWTKDFELSVAVPWAEGVTGFDVVDGKPILQGWVGGPSATALECLTDDIVKQQASLLLKRFTGKSDLPVPKNVFRSNWNQNPYVRGSYCHVTTDCDVDKIHCGNLTEPIYTQIKSGAIKQSPSILLAGEACHVKHYSTVHGAYESGQEQADIIIKYLKQCSLAKL